SGCGVSPRGGAGPGRGFRSEPAVLHRLSWFSWYAEAALGRQRDRPARVRRSGAGICQKNESSRVRLLPRRAYSPGPETCPPRPTSACWAGKSVPALGTVSLVQFSPGVRPFFPAGLQIGLPKMRAARYTPPRLRERYGRSTRAPDPETVRAPHPKRTARLSEPRCVLHT